MNAATIHSLARSLVVRGHRLVELRDLVQAGYLGLCEARTRLPDEHDGSGPYLRLRVFGAMMDALRKSDWASRAQLACRDEIRHATQHFCDRVGHSPSQQELASELQLSPEDFQRLRREALSVVEVASDRVNRSAASAATDPFARCARRQEKQLVRHALRRLPARLRQIVTLCCIDERPPQEIAVLLGISAGRVCQLRKQALTRLQRHLERDLSPP